ncbi:hypothetical protein BASA83_010382 [Batrachochytrium salamandrivorans]|nr:hypothetical protein BASA83_010382 [Batrachochytrium salamandrivorans]
MADNERKRPAPLSSPSHAASTGGPTHTSISNNSTSSSSNTSTSGNTTSIGNGKDCPPFSSSFYTWASSKETQHQFHRLNRVINGMDLGALTKDPLDSTDLDPKSLEATILTFQKKAIWAQMEEYQRQLDRTTRDMNSLESKVMSAESAVASATAFVEAVYETLQAITHLQSLLFPRQSPTLNHNLLRPHRLYCINLIFFIIHNDSVIIKSSLQQQGRIEMLESKLDTTDQLLIRTEKKLDRLRLQSNALPTSNSSATANNVNAIGRGAAIGNRSETTDSAMSASTPALHQSSVRSIYIGFEERAVEATRLAEFRLNEIPITEKGSNSITE